MTVQDIVDTFTDDDFIPSERKKPILLRKQKKQLKKLEKAVEAESANMSAMGVFDIKIRSKLPKNSDE